MVWKLLLLLGFCGLVWAEPESEHIAPEGASQQALRPALSAQTQVLVSAHPLASQAGYEMLRRGGSAVDALVATQLVLTLVEPQSSGLGGGAFALYWDAGSRRLHSFDGRETAPQGIDPALFLDEAGAPLRFYDAVVGPRSVATPGTLKLLYTLHQRYGRLSWAELFEPAQALARDGFRVSPRLAAAIAADAEHLGRFAETAAYFLPGGQPLAAGTRVRNPALADTLAVLAQEGIAPFYQGDLADRMVARVATAGTPNSALARTDLAAYRVIERPPVCVPYRSYRLCSMGPPSSGGIALAQILGMLAHHDLAARGPDDPHSWRLIGDASRLAFADRARYLADSDFVALPAGLLDADYLERRAALLLRGDALPEVRAGLDAPGQADDQSLELPSTSQISIRDRWGNVLSVTSTIENGFGARLMVGGFLLNNELTDFSFRPEVAGQPVANRIEPGKRPRSSMAPTIVFRGDEPYLVLGSPGGSRIIGYLVKTLVACLDWGMPLQQAIELPHALNRTGTFELEAGTAAERLAAPLVLMGYQVRLQPMNSGIHAIVLEQGQLIGVADSRREGQALGD